MRRHDLLRLCTALRREIPQRWVAAKGAEVPSAEIYLRATSECVVIPTIPDSAMNRIPARHALAG